MSQLWIPRVTRILASRPAVPFTTSTRRAVWHTTEGTSIAGALAAYRTHGGWPHITWDPDEGDIVQHYPASVGSRALKNPPGPVETNSFGALQIEVIGYARSPFTNGPMRGVERILAWLRANDVPDDWPAGQPLAYGPDERRPGIVPAAYGLRNGTRSLADWRKPGHFAHSQVPGNDHGDCGRVDIAFTQEDDVTPEDMDKIAAKVHALGAKRHAAVLDTIRKRPSTEAVASAIASVTAEVRKVGGQVGEIDEDEIARGVLRRLGELAQDPEPEEPTP